MAEHDKGNGNSGGSKWKLVFIGFALVAGFFLLTEHSAHVFGYLPYLLLLACPLMHLFGHGGHGGHRRGGGQDGGEDRGDGSPPGDSSGQQRHRH